MTSRTTSRRKVLQAVPAVAAVGLSGCTELSGSSSEDDRLACTTFDSESERNPLLRGVNVTPMREGPPALEVTLVKSELEETDARWIKVYNPEVEASTPEYTIPLNRGRVQPDTAGDEALLIKKQSVGHAPVTGRLRVEVQDDAGNVLAYREFSYECSNRSE